MQLKISSPTKVIFEGEIEKIILPTEIGSVIILPGHEPMVTALKPGIITISTSIDFDKKDFTITDDGLSISVGKGMAFVNNSLIKVVTTTITTKPNESEKSLKDQKSKLEKEIRELRQKGSLEEFEKVLIELEKINADLKLKKLSK